MALMYECGLRVKEIINLKIRDIDSALMIIHIRHSKGDKDRQVNLTPILIERLRHYYKRHKPTVYLFNGAASHPQYSRTSIRNVLKDNAIKAGIVKRVYPHLLRHCYATHQWEAETDRALIQKTLGHTNSKTTDIYTQLSSKKLNTAPSLLLNTVYNSQKSKISTKTIALGIEAASSAQQRRDVAKNPPQQGNALKQPNLPPVM